MNSLRLYWRYVGVAIRCQMQYRASFVLFTIGHFLSSGIEIISIWALFARFKSLGGWQLPEVAFFYGMINIAFALAEGIGRGFDTFSNLVKSGDFDRLLLRPRGITLQVSAPEVQFLRTGRLVQGLIVIGWAASRLHVAWSAARVGLALFAIVGGACLFCGLFVLQATMSFWSTETLELMNTVTYGGTETGQYPISIYKPWFRRFFTFVVPLACVTYFPALGILGRSDTHLGSPAWFHWIAPSIGVAFLAASFRVWCFGVRHYCSTGS